ncbi:PrpF domain-containing protein [Nesterenkonia cremea]|uniref:Methylaconitate Delta-isomerase PrpF n=1 Tax=Nesterenkonia cremea TaxID=1882340 RepID=A0A917ALV9_9MICC|nr:PrpF domain-containing protein [Nesterenkonia cremea]GGE60977.1 putative methylaconitate Delta-isomerase PrpF [Nesterenkonia cremea]
MAEVTGTWIRGGTSKCWVFETEDIEATGLTPDEFLPRIYGSPDHRQLDGVGGATSTTSKAMLLSRSEEPDIDVVYTFAQVGIDELKVDWGSNCGNCSSTAGLYAVEQGWVELAQDMTYVRTYNTNTGQLIVQRIPTPGGALPESPTAMIPGTLYPGYEVGLGFVEPSGKTLGALLPTGRTREDLSVAGTSWPVTLVDAGAPAVILPAEAVGLVKIPHEDWTDAVRARLAELDQVRRAGAVAMGMATTAGEAERAVPKLGIVGPSRTDGADLEVLMLSMGHPHPAMPITGSVAMTMASFTAGTWPAEFADADADPQNLRLRTPAGVIATFADDSGPQLIVGADRTARTLASARLHLPAPVPMTAV